VFPGLNAFVQSFNGQFTILVGTVILIFAAINEVLDRNHTGLLWLVRIVLTLVFAAGAAAEAAAWFAG